MIASRLEPKMLVLYGRGQEGFCRSLMLPRSGDGLETFRLDYAKRKCVSRPDGTLKHSLYLSIYRVIEHIPLDQDKDIYLVTKDGSTLGLSQQPYRKPTNWVGYGLYKEHCPVHPFIASSLEPKALADYIINDTEKKITVPAIIFNDVRRIAFDEGERHMKHV